MWWILKLKNFYNWWINKILYALLFSRENQKCMYVHRKINQILCIYFGLEEVVGMLNL